jgi:hypothetical protein
VYGTSVLAPVGQIVVAGQAEQHGGANALKQYTEKNKVLVICSGLEAYKAT